MTATLLQEYRDAFDLLAEEARQAMDFATALEATIWSYHMTELLDAIDNTVSSDD